MGGSRWRVTRGIGLEGLRKTTKYPSQRSGEPDRDTKPDRPEYKTGVFNRSVFFNWYPSCKFVIVSLLNLQWKHGCDVFKLLCLFFKFCSCIVLWLLVHIYRQV